MDCIYCAGTGWVTCVDLDGESAYETACPDCDSPEPRPGIDPVCADD